MSWFIIFFLYSRFVLTCLQVFGSVGPICESHRPEMYEEFLAAEGSTRVTQHFKTIAESLLEGGCDGLILDTMNSWSEARHALDGVAKAKGAQHVPIIVSLQVHNVMQL